MSSKRTAQMVARKHVNVMDRIEPAPRTPIPAFTSITRVDTQEVVSFTREKDRTTGGFWEEWNDLTLKDYVKSGLLGS